MQVLAGSLDDSSWREYWLPIRSRSAILTALAVRGLDRPVLHVAAYAVLMDLGDGTRCVHGGHTADGQPGAPLHPGPVLSSTFHLGPPDAALPDYFYGRPGNPTWTALEEAIGALDGGECVTFASGMAAIGAVLRLAARTGAAIVLPSDGYYVTRVLAHSELAPLGVEIREVPTSGPWP